MARPRRQKLLPWHPHGQLRIYVHPHQSNSTGNHRPLPFSQHCTQRQSLCGNSPRYAQPFPSRNPRRKTTYLIPWQLWLFPCSPHTRTMAPSMATNHLLPGCRRFRHQIHWQRTCQPPHPMPLQPLPRSRNRLGRQMLLWHPPKLGLYQSHMRSQYARLRRTSPTQISSPHFQKLQDSPYPATVKQYGIKVQLTDPIDTSACLPTHEIKRLQQIIGTFLFYGRAVDPTLLTTLSELSSAQATATEATKRACQQFLDYCASHPGGSIHYHASDMILKLHSDSFYLNAVGARSCQGGHLYLGNKFKPDILNGAVLNLAAIIKMVLSSTAKAEFGALFHNTKESTPLCTTLEELGLPQPPMPVLVDNYTAVGLTNDTVTQRRSRAINMHFYWVRDRVNQQQYHMYWAPTHQTLADYFTKHHTPSHHRKMCKYFVYTTASPKFLPTAPT